MLSLHVLKLLLPCLLVVASAENDIQILRSIADANKHNVKSIKSIHAVYDFSDVMPSTAKRTDGTQQSVTLSRSGTI